MAGSVMTFTQDEGHDYASRCGNVKKMIAAWTSDASAGNVNTGNVTPKIVGRLVKVQTVPGAGGVAPTNAYTVTIKDAAGIDVFAACDTNITGSNTTAQETYALVNSHANTAVATATHPVVCDPLTIIIASAGNSKQGTVTIFYEPV